MVNEITVSVNRSSFNGRNLFGFLQFGTLYKLMFVVLYLSTIHWKVNVQVAPESFPNTLYLIPPRAPPSSDNHSSACNRVKIKFATLLLFEIPDEAFSSLLKELSPRCLCQPKRKILDLGDSRTSLSLDPYVSYLSQDVFINRKHTTGVDIRLKILDSAMLYMFINCD